MDIDENDILPDNTIVYCVRDHIDDSETHQKWNCHRGELFIIEKYDDSDDTYLVTLVDEDNNRFPTWFYNKYESFIVDSNNEYIAHFWHHFLTKKQRVNRIREIAKEFVK